MSVAVEDHVSVEGARTNTCSIVALFCALTVLALPAVVFGVVGMRESVRRDEDGWGLAFAAVLIGGLQLVIGAAALAGFLLSLR